MKKLSVLAFASLMASGSALAIPGLEHLAKLHRHLLHQGHHFAHHNKAAAVTLTALAGLAAYQQGHLHDLLNVKGHVAKVTDAVTAVKNGQSPVSKETLNTVSDLTVKGLVLGTIYFVGHGLVKAGQAPAALAA